MSDLSRTPLFEFNVAHGGRMVDFAGWEMPVQFKSIVEEHKLTRSAAGLFDVSHMGEATVSGAQATEFLDFVLTNDIASMTEGRVVYSLMCYEHGGVVDDLLVYKKGDNDYMLCLNASNIEKDIAWLQSKTDGFEVEVTDVSAEYALLALQGPKAFDILEGICSVDFSDLGLGYYYFSEGTIADIPCIVSRTGYTGERGVELFVAPEQATELADVLMAAGESEGLGLAGLGARDSLRLEAGYSLYGHEISEAISPVQAKLMWTVKMDKTVPFVGQQALLDEKAAGQKKRIVFFKTGNRRIVRAETPVLANGEVVGTVVSGTFSPELNEAIGSILVDAAAATEELTVDMRGKAIKLFPTKPPFIKTNPQS